MSEHDQPNELFDAPAFIAMPEESWAREQAAYTAEAYAAPAEEEQACEFCGAPAPDYRLCGPCARSLIEDEGAESPAAVAVARARALLEEAGNLSQWRHLPDHTAARTRDAVWALCVAVEALEAQGVTLHEPAPDLAPYLTTERDGLLAENRELREERDQLRAARDAFRAELNRALAEIAALKARLAGQHEQEAA